MDQCPQCGGEIEEDFGLVTCPHCGETVLVGAEPPVEPNPQFHSEPEIEPALEKEQDEEHEFEQEFSISPSSPEEPPSEDSDNSFLDWDQKMEALAEEVQEASSTTQDEALEDEPGMEEVAEFGNSEESFAGGSLRYTVVIEGIDTADLRKDIKDSLTDASFVWNVDELMSAIEGGRLQLTELTPIKAIVLINRIKGYDVEIRWEQHSIFTS